MEYTPGGVMLADLGANKDFVTIHTKRSGVVIGVQGHVRRVALAMPDGSWQEKYVPDRIRVFPVSQ